MPIQLEKYNGRRVLETSPGRFGMKLEHLTLGVTGVASVSVRVIPTYWL